MSVNRSYPQPKLDWKPGDDPYTWPHGFVGIATYPGVCGVYLTANLSPRCMRREDDPIHRAVVKGN